MKRMFSLTLIGAMAVSLSAGPRAQSQSPGVVTGNVLQANGVISGTVKSSSGRPLSGITMQLVDARGTNVGKTVTAKNGDYTLAPAAFDTYTLQCVQKNKVIGTSSVVLKASTQSVDMTCTSDVVEWWKNTGVVAGLVAAALAVGAVAVVSTSGDASASR